MSMMYTRAAGYDANTTAHSEIARLVNPNRTLASLILQFSRRSTAGVMAANPMASEHEVMQRGASVSYMIIDPSWDDCPEPVQQNAEPHRLAFKQEVRKIKVCNETSFEYKLSHTDRYVLGSQGLEMLEKGLAAALNQRAYALTEPYFFSVLAAQAEPANQISKGGLPYNLTNGDDVIALFDDLHQRLLCANILQDFRESPNNIMLALPPCALKGLKEAQRKGIQCCDIARANLGGVLLGYYGFDVIMSYNLPRDPSGNYYAVWGDPSFIGFPYDFTLLEWNKVKTDYFLNAHMVWDAYVLNPRASGTVLVSG